MRDLNDLGFFAAVVAKGGVSAAARALGAPKSRVSRRLSALEQRLGVRLIERTTRRFKVTEVGLDVYRHARAALSEAEAIEDVAARLKSEPQGLVRLSCPLGLDRVLALALPTFLELHPKLRLQVIVTNRRIDLIDEGVDIAVRVREKLDTDADLQVRIIDRSSLLLVASADFVRRKGAPSTPDEIPNFPTLSLTDRPGLDRWTLTNSAGGEVEIAHEPRLSASGFTILRQAACEGLGIAFLSEYAARELLEEGVLVRILPDWAMAQGILHLVFTSRRGLLPGVRAVIDWAAAALRPGSPGFETA
ncbi:MAG: LysR substrate-binding domain-containing protein [Caulobacteraceae bacterium]